MSAPVILRNRSFAAAWAGQFLTQASARVFQVGMVWWLVGIVGGDSPGRQSGLVLMSATIPAVALVPVVSRLISRCDHRLLLALTAATAGALAAVGAALSATWALPLGIICALALLMACCQAVFDPCLTTSIPELVADEDIESATGFQLATQSIAGLTGGFLGPLVVEAIGTTGLLGACASAYLLAAVLIIAHRFPHQPPAPATSTQPQGSRHVLRKLPSVRHMLLCFTAANFFSTAVFVLMPLFVRSTLQSGGATVSALEAALGAGTIAGAALGPRLPLRLRTVGGAGLAATSLGLAAPGLVPHPWVAALGLVVAGVCIGAIGVRFVSYFQRRVPPQDKPAFFAIMQALISATLPVSSLVFGALGDVVPVRLLLLVQGAGLLPVAWAAWRVAAHLDTPSEERS
ncbi:MULTISPECIES: MFS transporter [unclassified Corynebacterium]|uniref:MFS transporter n=1 Tax=unclassified Corynebacterium TaxID=2624378 RepID=UPI0029CA83DF|nr:MULTISPECIES: MFS transporter [unclassified Corynebacterium]WPF66855.1 MFS transporter [Corynebacterium sp. 22KM0430]WPF69343.1 MFS transporter [Corynebacterium sp. 21KM1197]